MKQRQPTSIEDAVMRIVSALGRAEAAATVGKSETVVYAWADPDNDRKANVFDCLKLDAAYQSAGHGAAPILAAYRQVLRHLSDPEHSPAPLQDRCLEMVAEVGDVAAAIQAALSPTLICTISSTGPRHNPKWIVMKYL